MDKDKEKKLKKEKSKFDKFVKKWKLKIPKDYNQIKLIDDLQNPDIDFYVSISNRSDGKSFNYIGFLIDFSYEFDVGFTLMARHYTLRFAYTQVITKIMDEIQGFETSKLIFKRSDHYVMVIYKDKTVGVITDLSDATDLKYHSSFLKDFPIIIYDEFLAIEGDYLSDEWIRLKTIYETIDRKGDIPYIRFPKIFLLGNAVNFSSPLLANLNLFNKLENHPLNSVAKYGNILLEMNKNEHANTKKNTRAFDTENDNMNTAQFIMNKYKIASDNDRKAIKKNGDFFFIKLKNNYIKVEFNKQTFETMLSVVSNAENYTLCMRVSDINNGIMFLKDSYYSPVHYKKYEKGIFSFDNVYTKDTITQDDRLMSIKILKCIKYYLSTKPSDEIVQEKIYNDRYLERTKKAISNKFEVF